MSRDLPSSTASAVRRLCETHLDFRRIHSNMDRKQPRVAEIPKDSPTRSTLRFIEAEIGRLLDTLPAELRGELAPFVARTHVPELLCRLPGDAPRPSYESDLDQLLVTIGSGVDALRMELDHGMTPKESLIPLVIRGLLAHCDHQDAEDWRSQAARLLKTRPSELFGAILWYVRDRRDQDDPLTPPLSVFLADLIIQQVKATPAEAAEAALSAAQGSCTHDLAALILAGATIPVDGTIIPMGGPKAQALIQACRSNHGRLDLHAQFGPLHVFFEQGRVPDYRDIAAE